MITRKHRADGSAPARRRVGGVTAQGFYFDEAQRLLKPGVVCIEVSDDVRDFSSPHEQALANEGFTDVVIEVCEVDTPAECLCWKDKTSVVPIYKRR
jgi:hypothetical protein